MSITPDMAKLELEDDEDYEFNAGSDKPTRIKERTYQEISPKECADAQLHMDADQKKKFEAVLNQYREVFDGKLGLYQHKKVHIDLHENAKPVHRKAYPVPYLNENTSKEELHHLIREGVLSPYGPTEWGFPAFSIPKKDGSVRWVSDFRELNKLIKRPIYPLPRIQEIMIKRKGYKWFSIC